MIVVLRKEPKKLWKSSLDARIKVLEGNAQQTSCCVRGGCCKECNSSFKLTQGLDDETSDGDGDGDGDCLAEIEKTELLMQCSAEFTRCRCRLK